jgi:hypothetical protein
MGLWTFFKRCQHLRVRRVYGDEINFRNGYRWKCADCGVTMKKFRADRDYKVIQ